MKPETQLPTGTRERKRWVLDHLRRFGIFDILYLVGFLGFSLAALFEFISADDSMLSEIYVLSAIMCLLGLFSQYGPSQQEPKEKLTNNRETVLRD